MPGHKLRKKSGSALLSALFIMTLVAIAATAMSLRLQLDIHRTKQSLMSDKLYLASQFVGFWAMSELSKPINFTKSLDPFGKILNFPKKLQNIYPDLRIQGSLIDLQSGFNLNNLVDNNYFAPFLKLLENSIPLDPKHCDLIIHSLKNWISVYQPQRRQDEFISYYLKQTPPYYPSFQLLQHPSEFRLIKGVSAKLYQSLIKILTALPEITPINLNTASIPILMSLENGLNRKQVEEIIRARGKNGFKGMNEAVALMQKFNLRSELLTLESHYFLSIAFVSSDLFNITTYTVIKRSRNTNGKITVSILRESLNLS